jgi:hypothetical protein
VPGTIQKLDGAWHLTFGHQFGVESNATGRPLCEKRPNRCHPFGGLPAIPKCHVRLDSLAQSSTSKVNKKVFGLG